MASGLQDIPLRRIPEKWDRQWFAEFVRDVLRLGDARNIKIGSEFTLTGQSDEVASLSMALGGIALDKLEDQAGLSVIGNPRDTTGPLQALVAASDLHVLRRSGLAVGFGSLDSSYISDFEEASQDAVGSILTDSSSINFTYTDGSDQITAAVLPAGVDHNALLNYVADQHVAHSGVSLTAGAGLTGGGDISVSRTFAVGAGTGITVNADDVAVNLAATFAWSGVHTWSARQQVFGTTTANIALVSGLADTGVSIHSVEQNRIHRVAAEPFLTLQRVNGSYAAPTTLLNGDHAGVVAWGGYDGTTIQPQSAIIFLDVTETWSGSARGGNLRFQTTETGSTTLTDRLRLGANSTGGFAQVPSGAVGQCGLSFLVDPDNGLYYIGTNNWGAAAGGSKILDIATTGLGITGALNVSGTVTVPDTSFTYAKLQNVSASSRVLGRITAGAGVIEELTAANLATIVNSSLDHGTLTGLADDDHTQYVLRSILTTNGDLFTRTAGVIARLGIGTSLQLLRTVAGAPSWQTLSPVLTLGTDLSGNTTFTDLADATLNATIVNDAVTDAKLRNSAALSVIGRSANSIGDPADMAGTTDQVLRVNAAGTTLGFGTVATGGITANAVTNAKLAQMAQSTIKGRAAAAGTGDPTDLSAAQVATLIGTALAANPSASVGLSAVNGTAATYMASDSAPALSQSIAPTWSAQHIFSLAGSIATPTILMSSSQPVFAMDETDQSAGEQRWVIGLVTKTMQFRSVDASNNSIIWGTITRGTGNAISNIAFGDTTNNNSYTYGSTGLSTFSGAISTTRIAVTGTTVVTNGLYLSAANTPAIGSNSAIAMSWDASQNTLGKAAIRSDSPTAGVGYATGAGGTVTQATSRTTGVTLNKVCGSITLVSAAGTTSWQTFTVTNSAVAATDVIKICQKSGTDKYLIHITAVAAGSFDVTFSTTGGTTTEQPVFEFAVLKAVAA